MTFFRNIIHDLVEKRLWPVALALCAALIAIPMFLKQDPAPPVAAANGPSTATLADASVTAVDSPSRSRLDVGKERNPFQKNNPPKTTTTTTDTGTTTTSQDPAQGSSGTTPDTSSPSGGGGGGTGGGGFTPTPTPTPVPTPPAPGEKAWTLDVKFGKDGATKPIKAVLPGRALPSSTDAVVVYLNATANGVGAQFLVNSDARVQGDGTCKPSTKTCTVLTLNKGDTAFFDVGDGDETVQYELELTNIVRRTVE